MPVFKYEAVSSNGQRSKGSLDASSAAAAMAMLGERGLRVFEMIEVGARATKTVDQAQGAKNTGSPLVSGKKRIPQEEVLLCIQELATLLNAGIPLADSVSNIATGYADRALGDALQAAYASLRAGNTLAVAIKSSGLALPDYVYELVRAGEETGKLGASLTSAAEQMQADAEFRRETRNALTYPVVLIASGLMATLVVFVFVVPKFANILSNPKADIPAMSRWVLQSGIWLVENKLMATLSVGSVVAGLWALFSQASVRAQFWETASGLPVLGRWITHIELARWAGMFSVLLQHHVPLLDALRHSQNSLTGVAWRNKAEMIAKDVKGGQSLASAMQTHHFLDTVGLNLIRVGEQSGKLAHTTGSLATMHRTNAQQSMKQFLILLEPITILLVSVILGGIMISVMLAITSLTNVI